MCGWDVGSKKRGSMEATCGTLDMQKSVLKESRWCRRESRSHSVVSDEESRLKLAGWFLYCWFCVCVACLFPSFCLVEDLGFVFLRQTLKDQLLMNISGTSLSSRHCFPLKYSILICPVHLSTDTWCAAACSRWCRVIKCPTFFFFGGVLLSVRIQVVWPTAHSNNRSRY